MDRVKSLDGLRAISIIMVLIAHSRSSLPYNIGSNPIMEFLGNGGLAVKVFFAISGYLITKLLLVEQSKTGGINLKRFYLRRIFRIFPVFYLYIIVLLLLKIFLVPELFNNYLLVLSASLYVWNYKHLFSISNPSGTYENGNLVFGHFWTLAMEEQFYMLWPILFRKIEKNKLIKIVLILIVLIPIIRVLTYFIMPNSRGQIGMMLQTGGDTILVGCLGALIEGTTKFNLYYKKYLYNKINVYIVVVILLFIDPYLSKHFRGAYGLPIGTSLNNLCIIYFIFWVVYVPSIFQRILNHKVLIQIGVLSYSLYMWQQLFLVNAIHSWITRFPANIILLILVAVASYYLFEKPILKYKNKFKAV